MFCYTSIVVDTDTQTRKYREVSLVSLIRSIAVVESVTVWVTVWKVVILDYLYI
jgi:hypothetical protein